MQKKHKGMIFAIIMGLVIIGVCITAYFVWNQKGFNGNSIKNPDSYQMDFTRMNGEDMHSIYMEEGDSLMVDTVVTGGKVAVRIGMENEDDIYVSDSLEKEAHFTLTAQKSGYYMIRIKANHAKGSLHFYLEKM